MNSIIRGAELYIKSNPISCLIPRHYKSDKQLGGSSEERGEVWRNKQAVNPIYTDFLPRAAFTFGQVLTWMTPGCVSDFQHSFLTCSAARAQQELRDPCQSSLLEQQGWWEKLLPPAPPCQLSPLPSLCQAALGALPGPARLESGNWCWQRTWELLQGQGERDPVRSCSSAA